VPVRGCGSIKTIWTSLDASTSHNGCVASARFRPGRVGQVRLGESMMRMVTVFRFLTSLVLFFALATPVMAANGGTWTCTDITDNTDRLVVHCHLATDASDANDYPLVDADAVTGTPSKLALLKLTLTTSDQDSTWLFEFNDATDSPIAGAGGMLGKTFVLDLMDTDGFLSPTISGTTGDVYVTTTSISTGLYANLVMVFRKVP